MVAPFVPGTQPCGIVTLTMFLSYKGFGWSEKYMMAKNSAQDNAIPFTSDIQAAALDGCNRRMHLCGLGVTMVWARLTDSLFKKRSNAVLSGPLPAVALTAESPIEKVNEIGDSLLFRFESSTGITRNLILRGLRDSWVTDEDVTSSLVPAVPLLVATDTYTGGAMPGPYTMANALKNFLLWVGFNTVNYKKSTSTTGIYLPFTSIMYRNVTRRQTGRPFGLHRGRASNKV